jgi:uncharacterized protein YkwD
MRDVSLGSPAGVALAVVVAGALAWSFAGGGAGGLRERSPEPVPVADGPGCPGSGTRPASTAATRRVIVCLLNRERAARGLGPLGRDRRLERAAQAHAADMVRLRFFEHEGRDGRSPHERIDDAGYPRSPATGENLGWGEGAAGVPVRIVTGWMQSPGHRENILRERFTEVGVGVVFGAPDAVEQPSVTYVTAFGGGPL